MEWHDRLIGEHAARLSSRIWSAEPGGEFLCEFGVHCCDGKFREMSERSPLEDVVRPARRGPLEEVLASLKLPMTPSTLIGLKNCTSCLKNIAHPSGWAACQIHGLSMLLKRARCRSSNRRRLALKGATGITLARLQSEEERAVMQLCRRPVPYFFSSSTRASSPFVR
jgi:hypothetical protein